MKTKALLAALFLAGVMSSLALGATGHHREGVATTSTVTTSTVTTTTPKHVCRHVSLRGAATGGSVAFNVTRGHDDKTKLAGTAATLAIPAGARVVASVCIDANGALTLRSLQVQAKQETKKQEGNDH